MIALERVPPCSRAGDDHRYRGLDSTAWLIQVIRCWIHETCRVFCDRLVDDEDRKWFYGVLQRQAREAFSIDFADAKEVSSVIFADFVQQTPDRHYVVSTSLQ